MELPTLNKTFVYVQRRYFFDVIVTGLVGAAALVVSLVLLVLGLIVPIAVVLAIVSAYVVLNTFLAHAYPRSVSVEQTVLRLESFGKVEEWDLSNNPGLTLRENARSKSIYLRMEGAGLLSGRYFIGCGDMVEKTTGEPADDLYSFLVDVDSSLHPDSIRTRARRQD